jgi:hypothetical protein
MRRIMAPRGTHSLTGGQRMAKFSSGE